MIVIYLLSYDIKKGAKLMAKHKIINIAVIAHVDAGKSTLVDAFLSQSGIFRANEEVRERVWIVTT